MAGIEVEDANGSESDTRGKDKPDEKEVLASNAKRERFLRFYLLEERFDKAAPPPRWEMDSELWSQLPADALQRVLKWLPHPIQCRFRLVSKHWLEVLASEEFRRSSAAMAFAAKPGVCAWQHSYLELANDLQQQYKVHDLELSFVPEEFSRYHVLAVSHYGLMCIPIPKTTEGPEAEYVQGQRICVINPANKTWKELPSLHLSLGKCEYFVVPGGSMPSEYKVIVMCRDRDRWEGHCFAVYSSITETWTLNPVEQGQEYNFKVDTVVGREFWYAKGDWDYDTGDELMHYSSETGLYLRATNLPHSKVEAIGYRWGKIAIINYPDRDALLFVSAGETGCRIHELKEANEQWVEIAVMPETVLPNTSALSRLDVDKVQVSGSMVWIQLVAFRSETIDTHLVAFHTGHWSWRCMLSNSDPEGYGPFNGELELHDLKPSLHL